MTMDLHRCTGLSLGGIGKAEIRMGKLTCFCAAQAHAMYRGVNWLRGSICCGTVLEGLGKPAPNARCTLHAIGHCERALAALTILGHCRGDMYRLQQRSPWAELEPMHLAPFISEVQAVDKWVGHCREGMQSYQNWERLRGTAGLAMSVFAPLVPAGTHSDV